ncbi:Hpt domain-containing protein [Aliiglaciecola litoralis]|uniref:HPt domain-containing protein n=1 Tax=Aliiglaciecola litoralis TaxID=582857 RepID=A0ABP3WZF4_9ALTE
MVNQAEIIDLKFALSQLSGNHALLIKLLGKFSTEYIDLPERLTNMQANGDARSYQSIVHTIKGVSGNLGLNALHDKAKKLESSLLSEQDTTADFIEFKAVLEQTLQQIQDLSAETTKVATEAPPQSPAQVAQKQLYDTLQRNEFLPPEKLDALLGECQFPILKQRQLENAISDLDYPEALHILDSI